jgi:hypothetical protein
LKKNIFLSKLPKSANKDHRNISETVKIIKRNNI